MSIPPRSSSSSLLAAWLCAVAGIGCPAAQVKPEPSDCPQEAVNAMFEVLKVWGPGELRAIVDINQPGDMSEMGSYQDGPVIGRLVEGRGDLVAGTLLHGRLWTGPGIKDYTNLHRESVMGRYTLAVLPDGRKYPVCIVLGNPDDGLAPKHEGSNPGAALLNRELPVSAVRRWP